MFLEDASLIECERWLKELDYRSRDHDDVAKRTVEQVLHLVNDEFMQNVIRISRVDAEGLWLKDQGGVKLPLRDMSDGYRAAVALLIDIARHMMAVYGPEDLIAEDTEGRPHVARDGVVLID